MIADLNRFRVAAVQFPLEEGGTPDRLLSKIENFISEAKLNGAQLLVFPELIGTELVQWSDDLEKTKLQLEKVAVEFTPFYMNWLKDKSSQYGLYILGGTTPRKLGQNIVNTAILAGPGNFLVLQDKMFLTPDEKTWGWKPAESLQVFSAPWGKTVIATCFDSEFPVISNLLVEHKPDFILVPSWTGTESGLNRVGWSAQARAIEHYAFVVKTGTIPGQNATQSHFGKASIITPQETGFPLLPVEGRLNQSEIIYGDLDLALLREKKPKSGYYPGNEQLLRRAPVRIESEK